MRFLTLMLAMVLAFSFAPAFAQEQSAAASDLTAAEQTKPETAGPIDSPTEILTDVEQIVKKANHVAYYQGTNGRANVKMVITDSKGQSRQREFIVLRADVEEGKDQKYYVYFERPADVRKMVFMVHKHIDKDDDRWLYMPSLDLVKRIAASDKRTSFAGSDFLYEDVSGRNLADDTHELTETNEQYYVIKNTPKKPDTVEFKYFNVFVDKKTLMPMKMEYYDSKDKLYRTIESKKVELIETKEGDKTVKYPTVTQSVVKDLNTGSTTEMGFSNIKYNIEMEDIFTERYMKLPPRDIRR